MRVATLILAATILATGLLVARSIDHASNKTIYVNVDTSQVDGGYGGTGSPYANP